jgi:glycosyltransferase involved in cell wall biosynthesis
VSRPLFSICIPTRNRSEYLRNCVWAALNQDFDDYEVVISDNNSVDDTSRVMSEFQDGRIRYSRTERDISASENFDRAADAARGTYFLLIADDEILIPEALSSVKALLEATDAPIIRFACNAYYYYPNSLSNGDGNLLRIDPFTGDAWRVKAADVLEVLFNLDCFVGDKHSLHYAARPLPLGARTVTRKDLYEKIKSRVGAFHSPEPMYSSAVYLLNEVDEVLVCDRHLCLGCVLPDSPSRAGEFLRDPTTGWDKETIDGFYKDFTAPVDVRSTVCSYQTSGILVAQRLVSPDLDDYAISLKNYAARMVRELYTLHEKSIDVADDIRAMQILMDANGLRDDFMYHFDRFRRWKPRYLGYCLRRKIEHMRSAADEDQVVWKRLYRGDMHGFEDVLGCLAQYEKIANTITNRSYPQDLLRKFYPDCIQLEI